MSSTPLRLLPWLALAAIPLVACNSGSRQRAGTAAPATPAPAASLAAVRVLHASADAPPVDVLVDGQVALAGVPYKTGSGFLDVPGGERRLQVVAAGTTTSVIDVRPTLAGDQAYTVIAVGRLAQIEPLLLQDDRTPPAPGELRLRVVHGHPLAGQVDLYVTAPGADLALAAPTLAGLSFKDASGFLDVPAGRYQARLTPAGARDVVYDSGPLDLPAGALLTLVAAESGGGASPVTLLGLTGDAAAPSLELPNVSARVRAVHASPDAPAVDVLVDGGVALQGVRFGQASGYLEVRSGARRLQVNPANTTMSVIDATLPLQAGADYTVIAADRVARIAPLVLRDDLTPPAAGQVRLRLVHGAPSAGLVDVYVTAPGADLALATPTVSGFAFKDATAYLEVPAGDYRVRITLAGTKSVAIDTGALSLAAGQVRTGVALDPAPGSAAFSALLLADQG